jgi:4-hydroxy-tetrahydrodipicolinate synthase
MKNTIFKGMASAIVTPMTETGIDYDALGRFVEFQIENGINAIVVMGTTGENATIEYADQKEVIRFTVETVAKRVPVIAGTGTNNTEHVLDFTKSACDDGADAVLVVTPYYNKATQNGLIKHYERIADYSAKPVIMYNVPGRTGCNLAPQSCAILADHPNIAAIKEASGNMAQAVEMAALCGDKLDIYSGEDGITLPLLSIGGMGCISVASNVAPRQMVDIVDKFFAGDVAGAAQMQKDLYPLIKLLFCEVNPIPVKAAMAAMGYCENRLRLPLTQMEPQNELMLLREMRKLGVLR